MPIKPIIPIIAMNVNGWRNSSSDGVIPQNTNGKQIMMRKTFFQLLKSNSSMPKMANNVSGKYLNTFVVASACNSISPTHRMLYPLGNLMASISSFISDNTFAGVASNMSVLGSHSASMARCPLMRYTDSSSHSRLMLSVTLLNGTLLNRLSCRSSEFLLPVARPASSSCSKRVLLQGRLSGCRRRFLS